MHSLSRRGFLRGTLPAVAALAAPVSAMAAAPLVEPATPAPLPTSSFDHEAAIRALEKLGIQLGAQIIDGHNEGICIGPNDVYWEHWQECQAIMNHERGFSPYRMAEVLAAQGKIGLPDREAA